jgi:hypothetical protein
VTLKGSVWNYILGTLNINPSDEFDTLSINSSDMFRELNIEFIDIHSTPTRTPTLKFTSTSFKFFLGCGFRYGNINNGEGCGHHHPFLPMCVHHKGRKRGAQPSLSFKHFNDFN